MIYEPGVNFSSLISMFGSKNFFAGVAEIDKPGPIQVLRHPWNKLFEIQAHSSPVEKLRLTYDNNWLLSCGRDGVLCIFEVKDKEPKIRRDGKEL
jgi:cilia- and flagella-associated protein 57